MQASLVMFEIPKPDRTAFTTQRFFHTPVSQEISPTEIYPRTKFGPLCNCFEVPFTDYVYGNLN